MSTFIKQQGIVKNLSVSSIVPELKTKFGKDVRYKTVYGHILKLKGQIRNMKEVKNVLKDNDIKYISTMGTHIAHKDNNCTNNTVDNLYQSSARANIKLAHVWNRVSYMYKCQSLLFEVLTLKAKHILNNDYGRHG